MMKTMRVAGALRRRRKGASSLGDGRVGLPPQTRRVASEFGDRRGERGGGCKHGGSFASHGIFQHTFRASGFSVVFLDHCSHSF